MSKGNWVCWDCETTARPEWTKYSEYKCPKCGELLIWIGFKVEVPKKNDKQKWEDLRQSTLNYWYNFVKRQNEKIDKLINEKYELKAKLKSQEEFKKEWLEKAKLIQEYTKIKEELEAYKFVTDAKTEILVRRRLNFTNEGDKE